MKKFIRTALCMAAACTMGFALTACDKDKDENNDKITGSVTYDGQTMPIKSAFYVDATENGISRSHIILLPDEHTALPEQEPAVYVGLYTTTSGTSIDMSKAASNEEISISLYAGNNYYRLYNDNDGFWIHDENAGNDFEVASGTLKLSKKGGHLDFQVSGATKANKTFTLTLTGLAIYDETLLQVASN